MLQTQVTHVDHHHAHHFESEEHEFESAKQGMWLFLVQEVLFFSALFVGYAVLRALYPDMMHAAHKMLDWKLGALNTVVLICSSLTMALAVHAAQTGYQKRLINYLILTFLCACIFLVVKYFEYTHKIHVGLLPAGFFTNTELTHPKSPLFFSLYFVMTGLHGLHVIGGMIAMLWLLKRAAKGQFGPNYFTPVEMVGLYWHFVDLVWIYLFPLLYLVG